MKGGRFLVLAISMMVVAVLLSGVNCLGGTSEGKVPVFKTGDQWLWAQVFEDTTFDMSVEITDTSVLDDEECYIMDMTFDPPLYETFDTMRLWMAVGEPFFSPLKIQMETTVLGEPYSVVTECSAEYPDEDPWPLEVGNEFTLVQTMTTTITISGETATETETETSVIKVEGKEDITVSAGEFTCFVIKDYNEENELLNTYWYSDEVKNDVKSIDAVEGENSELKSYSFA